MNRDVCLVLAINLVAQLERAEHITGSVLDRPDLRAAAIERTSQVAIERVSDAAGAVRAALNLARELENELRHG